MFENFDVQGAHAQTTERVLVGLKSHPQGLGPEQVAQRQLACGPNALPQAPPASALRVFLRQFGSPFIYILMVAAVVSIVIGDVKDAGFIFAVLLLNAVVGALQEYRAARSAEALRGVVSPRAHVLRQREECEIPAEQLVPGDIVIIESGTKIPADLRLLSVAGSLQIDESLLTGESIPVLKRPGAALEADVVLADRVTMAFAGTLVTLGRAYGIVVAIGVATELGKIAKSLSTGVSSKPPLIQRMDRFTRKIAVAVGLAVLTLGGLMLLRGAAPYEVFLLAVALAVSVIPEGLPVAMTVALAIAARRMSERRVIARRLAAVEALGSCTFIATDKTGTLTMNELTVEKVSLPGEVPWTVTGVGASAEGSVLIPGVGPLLPPQKERLDRLCTAVVLCNDASLAQRDGSFTFHGDAVDVSLLFLGEKCGLSRAAAETQRPRIGALPFEAQRQFAATANEAGSNIGLSVKGASERVVAMCSRMATADGDVTIDAPLMEERASAMAGDGYRVLAIASGVGRCLEDGELEPDGFQDLVLLGFVGIRDPIRPEVPGAIEACRKAGIEVAMVTGDHPQTARSVASKLGLIADDQEVVTGPQLQAARRTGEAAVDALVQRSRVFARLEPDHKLEIVQSLIRTGHFVAVTGDGANDAPAMLAANIGVAMGARGTDVAKETGQLIISDDNFASLLSGIEEGRVAYNNVRKVVFLLVSSGAAELVLFTLSIMMGLPMPLYPAQILWLNLVTNGIQDLALAFEPAEGDELKQKPRAPREPIFNGLMLRRTALSAGVMGGLGFGLFQFLIDSGWAVDDARNTLLLLLVLFENVQAGNARSERLSLFALSPTRNPLLLGGVILAQGVHILAMHVPALQEILRIGPVSAELWLILLAVALLLFVVVELDKWRRRARARGQ